MKKIFSEICKQPGVSTILGYKAVELIKKSIQVIYKKVVMSDLGKFEGFFKLNIKANFSIGTNIVL